MPELAHQGIFQLLRVSVNCYVKTMKKYRILLNLTDFMKILSKPQDHCGSQNNFMIFFRKNILFMVFNSTLNLGFRLNRLAFNDTKTYLYISEVKDKKIFPAVI